MKKLRNINDTFETIGTKSGTREKYSDKMNYPDICFTKCD